MRENAEVALRYKKEAICTCKLKLMLEFMNKYFFVTELNDDWISLYYKIE